MLKNSKDLTRICCLIEGKLTTPENAEDEFPSAPGLCAFYVDSIESLPSEFKEELRGRNTNLLYIGKSKNLKKRMIKEHLTGGTSTLFRSIGTMLNYGPEFGSLRGKGNNNYFFDDEVKKMVIGWIRSHLVILWCTCEPYDLNKDLVEQLMPILNIKWNPQKFEPLIRLRKKCLMNARG